MTLHEESYPYHDIKNSPCFDEGSKDTQEMSEGKTDISVDDSQLHEDNVHENAILHWKGEFENLLTEYQLLKMSHEMIVVELKETVEAHNQISIELRHTKDKLDVQAIEEDELRLQLDTFLTSNDFDHFLQDERNKGKDTKSVHVSLEPMIFDGIEQKYYEHTTGEEKDMHDTELKALQQIVMNDQSTQFDPNVISVDPDSEENEDIHDSSEINTTRHMQGFNGGDYETKIQKLTNERNSLNEQLSRLETIVLNELNQTKVELQATNIKLQDALDDKIFLQEELNHVQDALMSIEHHLKQMELKHEVEIKHVSEEKDALLQQKDKLIECERCDVIEKNNLQERSNVLQLELYEQNLMIEELVNEIKHLHLSRNKELDSYKEEVESMLRESDGSDDFVKELRTKQRQILFDERDMLSGHVEKAVDLVSQLKCKMESKTEHATKEWCKHYVGLMRESGSMGSFLVREIETLEKYFVLLKENRDDSRQKNAGESKMTQTMPAVIDDLKECKMKHFVDSSTTKIIESDNLKTPSLENLSIREKTELAALSSELKHTDQVEELLLEKKVLVMKNEVELENKKLISQLQSMMKVHNEAKETISSLIAEKRSFVTAVVAHDKKTPPVIDVSSCSSLEEEMRVVPSQLQAEIQHLTEENHTMLTKIDAVSSDNENLQRLLDDLKMENQSINDRLLSSIKEKDVLEIERNDLKLQVNQLSSKLGLVEESVSRLLHENEVTNAECTKRLAAEKSNTQDKLQEYISKNNEINDEMIQLMKTMESLRLQKDELESQLNSKHSDFETLQSLTDEAEVAFQEKIRSLLNEIEVVNHEMSDLAKSKESFEKDNVQLSQKVSCQGLEIEQLKLSLKSIETKLEHLETEKNNAFYTVAVTTKSLDESEEKVNELEGEIQTLTVEIERISSESEGKGESLFRQLTEVRVQLKEAKQHALIASQEYDKSLSAMKHQIASSDVEMSTNKEKIASLQLSLENLTNECSCTKEKLEETLVINKSLLNERNFATRQLDEMTLKLESLSQQSSGQISERESLIKQLENITDELQCKDDLISELQSKIQSYANVQVENQNAHLNEIAQLTNERDALQQQFTEAERILDHQRRQLDIVKLEHDELSARLRDKNDEHKELDLELQHQKAVAIEMEKQLENMKMNLRKKENEIERGNEEKERVEAELADLGEEMNSGINVVNSKLHEKEDEITHMKLEMQHQNVITMETEKQIEDIKLELAKKIEEIKLLVDAKEKNENQISTLQDLSKVSEMKVKDLSNLIMQFNKERDELQKERDELQLHIGEMENIHEEHQLQSNKIASDVKELTSNLQCAHDENIRLQKQSQLQNSTIAKMEEQIKKIKKEVTEKKSELANLNKLKQKETELVQSNKKTIAEANVLRGELHRIKAIFQNHNLHIEDDIASQMKTFISEVTETRFQIKEVEQRASIASQEYDESLSAMKHQIASNDAAISTHKENIASLQESLESLTNKCSCTQAKLEKTEVVNKSLLDERNSLIQQLEEIKIKLDFNSTCYHEELQKKSSAVEKLSSERDSLLQFLLETEEECKKIENSIAGGGMLKTSPHQLNEIITNHDQRWEGIKLKLKRLNIVIENLLEENSSLKSVIHQERTTSVGTERMEKSSQTVEISTSAEVVSKASAEGVSIQKSPRKETPSLQRNINAKNIPVYSPRQFQSLFKERCNALESLRQAESDHESKIKTSPMPSQSADKALNVDLRSNLLHHKEAKFTRKIQSLEELVLGLKRENLQLKSILDSRKKKDLTISKRRLAFSQGAIGESDDYRVRRAEEVAAALAVRAKASLEKRNAEIANLKIALSSLGDNKDSEIIALRMKLSAAEKRQKIAEDVALAISQNAHDRLENHVAAIRSSDDIGAQRIVRYATDQQATHEEIEKKNLENTNLKKKLKKYKAKTEELSQQLYEIDRSFQIAAHARSPDIVKESTNYATESNF